MRTLLVSLMLAIGAPLAAAQVDTGTQVAQQAQEATQQAMQAAHQANEQAIEAAQQASQNAAQATQDAWTTQWGAALAATPKFSKKPGTYSSPVTVKITDKTRGAVIYYRTDGWTPTAKSARYKGPFTIGSTTTVQAVAIAPYFIRSWVATAQYTINTPTGAAVCSPASAHPAIPPVLSADGKVTLPKGMPVQLVFGGDVSSKTAAVGDKVLLTLADDLRAGEAIIAKKGSPAVARMIQVDKTGAGGLPGEVEFEVESLDVNGITVKLHGSAAKEGQDKPPNAAVLIPVVGPFTVLKHGTDAVIAQGTPFTAHVAADTTLPFGGS